MLTLLTETFSDQPLSSGDSQPVIESANVPPLATIMPDLASVKDYRVVTVALAMAKNLKHQPTIEELAHSVNLSVNQLEVLFKGELKHCPKQYLARLRMDRACFLLVNTELRVSQIMVKVGFKQTGYFSATFRSTLGCTPKEFRKRSHVLSTFSISVAAFFQDFVEFFNFWQ